MWYIQWKDNFLRKGFNYLTSLDTMGKPILSTWGTLYAAKGFDSKEEAYDYIECARSWKDMAIPTFVHPMNFHARCDRGEN